MSNAHTALWLVLAAPVVQLLCVAIFVGSGVLFGKWAKWNYALPMDAAQTLAFKDVRASTLRRMRGFAVEVWWQSLAFTLLTLHVVKLLPTPRGRPGGMPVLLLPGYTENAGTMWWMGRRLVRAGFNPILIDFPSTFDRIESNARYLAERIAAIRAEHGAAKVAIVAHSMGGLITRTMMHTEPDHRVHALVAIASPFRGSHFARVGSLLGWGASVSQMIPGSVFLQDYPSTLALPVATLSMVAFQEDIVHPEWSVVIDGAQVRVLDEPYGHEAPLFVAGVFAEIEAWLVAQGVTRAPR